MARELKWIQADIDVCQSEIDHWQNKIWDAERQKADNLRQRDSVSWGGMDYARAAGAAEANNRSLGSEISEWQKYLKPLKAQMEELRQEARDPEGYSAAKAERERKAEKESNDRRYKKQVNKLSVIAAQPVNDDISFSAYRSQIDALDRIKRGLKELPGGYDTAVYIEKCDSLHEVFEKGYNDRWYKNQMNELSEIAAQPVNDGISSSTYHSRITALNQIICRHKGLPAAYDTVAYIEKCDSLQGVFEKGLEAAKTREAKKTARWKAKMRRAEITQRVGRVTLSGFIGAASGGVAAFLLSVIVGYGGKGIPYMRYESGLPGVCAISAVIGVLIGSVVGRKTY